MLIYKSQYIIAFCLLLLACTSGGEGTETDPIQPSQPEETRPKMPIPPTTVLTTVEMAFHTPSKIPLMPFRIPLKNEAIPPNTEVVVPLISEVLPPNKTQPNYRTAH